MQTMSLLEAPCITYEDGGIYFYNLDRILATMQMLQKLG